MPTIEIYVIFQTIANNKVQTYCQCLNHSHNNMRKALLPPPPSGPFFYPTVYSNHTLFYNTYRVTVTFNEYYLFYFTKNLVQIIDFPQCFYFQMFETVRVKAES